MYEEKFDFHNNAAALIVAAAQRSGLRRDVANALRCSQDVSRDGSCLACGVLDQLTENFGEHCGSPGYDFYGEGFCVTQYTDAELESFLHVPFQLPMSVEEVNERYRQIAARCVNAPAEDATDSSRHDESANNGGSN
jgi:hypothetical protein